MLLTGRDLPARPFAGFGPQTGIQRRANQLLIASIFKASLTKNTNAAWERFLLVHVGTENFTGGRIPSIEKVEDHLRSTATVGGAVVGAGAVMMAAVSGVDSGAIRMGVAWSALTGRCRRPWLMSLRPPTRWMAVDRCARASA